MLGLKTVYIYIYIAFDTLYIDGDSIISNKLLKPVRFLVIFELVINEDNILKSSKIKMLLA